jgi:hypothetical protein
VERRPIVLLDQTFWGGLVDWMKSNPLKRALISPPDFDFLSVVDGPERAAEIIAQHHKEWLEVNGKQAT